MLDTAIQIQNGLMSMSFRDAFLKSLDETGISVAEVARRSGVSKDQLHKLKQGKSESTNIEDAIKVARVFGCSIDQFLQSPGGSAPHRVSEIYTQLSEDKRLKLEGFAEGLLAQ